MSADLAGRVLVRSARHLRLIALTCAVLSGCGARTELDIETLGPAVQVVTQGANSCALYSGGAVRCWGGPLWPDEETVAWYQPVVVYELPGAVQIGVGTHGCARMEGGHVLCWGNDCAGQLGTVGDGSLRRSSEPIEVPGIDDAVELSVGFAHTCVLRSSGEIWCWGMNDEGQLGDGTTTTTPLDSSCDQPEYLVSDIMTTGRATPMPVTGIQDAIDVSAGRYHTCALLRSGGVRCWGSRRGGLLGDGISDDGASLVPTDVVGLQDAVEVSAGWFHTCARRQSGQLVCWGDNGNTQLGNGMQLFSARPVAVPDIDDAIQVSAGREWTCALRASGEVWCWGSNEGGTAGLVAPDLRPRTTPGPVGPAPPAQQLSAGFEMSCLLDRGGAIDCWGYLGSGWASAAPVPLPAPR